MIAADKLAGATPEVWDGIHGSHREAMPSRVYPLASAPERAMLRAALAHCRLRQGDVVAELGCGSSRYLPYLALQTGARVAGVDFSEIGIERTRRELTSVGVDYSQVELGRIEDYAPAHANRFDAVISFGLVEHFDDLDGVVRDHFICVRPGGRILICAPNLSGPNLAWARATAPRMMTWHRPISAAKVAWSCDWSGGIDISIKHLGGPRLFAYPDIQGMPGTAAKLVRKALNGVGEALDRVSPDHADEIAGRALNPFFAVAATRAE